MSRGPEQRVINRLRTLACLVTLSAFLVLAPFVTVAESACSKVSIEIAQELTLERIAFDAKLVVTNNMTDKDLTNLDVDILIKDAEGNEQGALFYIAQPTFKNITDVSGNGVVPAGQQSEVHWLIIPSPGAGGESPDGNYYWVGATIRYSIEGSEEEVTVNPDRILVRPEAQLVLDYFVPYKVMGDNPFTPVVEPPIPFPLAVRVLNDGYGAAHALKIESAQPKITENNQGLLVDFQLLGASVNDSAVDPTLTVDIGELPSKGIAKAYWEMISTLSGEFTEFDVSFTHDAGLGGELTSLIRETNSHYFVHKVKVNLPGRDGYLDILADSDRDTEHYPDTIFESEIPGNSTLASDSQSPVGVVNTVSVSGRPTALSPEVDIIVDAFDTGWVYTRTNDPGNGMLNILKVLRYDGVEIDPHNFWISHELDDNYHDIYLFHLLDYRANASVPGRYKLIYEQPTEDLMPPYSHLQFNGPWVEFEKVYITADTNIIFLATDNEGGSGVEQVLRKVVGSDTAFIPAYPFHITEPGAVDLEYYSIDRAGNEEPVNTAYLYVDDAGPDVSVFEAVPDSFSPHAPRGIVSAKSTELHVTATDAVPELTGTVEIASGAEFSEANIVRTLDVTVLSAEEGMVQWDGRDNDGVLLAAGAYTARLSLTDGLDWETQSHTTVVDIPVEVAEWFQGQPVDENLSGAQMEPDVSSGVVVWQDNRSGNWDIYMKDVYGTDGPVAVTTNMADQTMPSIDGSTVVWQDQRDGDWDIYRYDITTGGETSVRNASGNQERPVVSGAWVAWQDDSAGNWDIYAYNLDTDELIQVTSHERDQINPAISGTVLTWEDYRHGLGEIYTYDFESRTEQRRTFNIYTQTYPSISGDTLIWTDRRTEQRDIFYLNSETSETRVTYGAGDHTLSTVSGALIVYEDYESGLDDANLSFYHITTGIGAQLTSHPSQQDTPAVDAPVLVWQDDRNGVYQAYWAELEIEVLPLEVPLKTGFNLIAVGDGMTAEYASSSELIAADLGIEKVVTRSSLNDIYLESSEDVDIAFVKGMGLGIYATKDTSIAVAQSGETAAYTLLPGLNYIGMLTVRPGYTAYELIASVGTENIQSVQRYETRTGTWQTAAVKVIDGTPQIVGPDFEIQAGEGLVITMHSRVDGWRP